MPGPPAKGRVERGNGVRLERLVKELRRAGINDLTAANRLLEGKSLRAFPQQWARVAASPGDVPRPGPRNLDEGLNWEEQRVVPNDWPVACDGQRFQLAKSVATRSLVRRHRARAPLTRRPRAVGGSRSHPGLAAAARGCGATQAGLAKASQAKTARAVQLLVGKHRWRRFGIAAGQNFQRRGARAGNDETSKTKNQKRGHSLGS